MNISVYHTYGSSFRQGSGAAPNQSPKQCIFLGSLTEIYLYNTGLKLFEGFSNNCCIVEILDSTFSGSMRSWTLRNTFCCILSRFM